MTTKAATATQVANWLSTTRPLVISRHSHLLLFAAGIGGGVALGPALAQMVPWQPLAVVGQALSVVLLVVFFAVKDRPWRKLLADLDEAEGAD